MSRSCVQARPHAQSSQKTHIHHASIATKLSPCPNSIDLATTERDLRPGPCNYRSNAAQSVLRRELQYVGFLLYSYFQFSSECNTKKIDCVTIYTYIEYTITVCSVVLYSSPPGFLDRKEASPLYGWGRKKNVTPFVPKMRSFKAPGGGKPAQPLNIIRNNKPNPGTWSTHTM